jgi:endonuclease IV
MNDDNNLILGFNSGAARKIAKPISNEMIELIFNSGANAIELSVQKLDRIAGLADLDLRLLKKFRYVSIHLPNIMYKNDSETINVISQINSFCERTRIDLLVLHPDFVEDWDVIQKFNVNVAIENMDNRKNSGKTPEEIQILTQEHNLDFVLDINHVFTVDPTMNLREKFLNLLGERLREFHVSGYSKEFIHMPISESKQDFLLKGLLKKVPIILESSFNLECSPEKMKQEVEYIKKCLLVN